MGNFRPVVHILSVLLVILSIFMTLPVNLLWFGDHSDWQAFVSSSAITLAVALVGLFITRRDTGNLKQKEMFVLTVSSWIILPGFASLPLLLSDLHLSVTDAFFESLSGITTTGSTVLVGLDDMGQDILLWRSIIQWMGGIGIIGMAVAILPFLGVGGMRLFATESSEWTEKALPRTGTLGKGLMLVYVSLTLACVLVYWASGMSLFNALNHALTTLSTGGYSTSDSSMGQFDSDLILLESSLFMMLGALPFFLFVRFINGQRNALWCDAQVLAFLKILFIAAALITAFRIAGGEDEYVSVFISALFNVTSIVTTTGYASEDYSLWGPVSVALFFFLTFIGGCSGSTSGGMKVFRFQLAYMLLREQMKNLLHPNAILSRKYNGRVVSNDIITSCIAFLTLFMVTLAALSLVLSLQGLDLVTSVTGAATALTNVGPGLGELIGPAGNFKSLPDAAKWTLCVGMLLGRLELLSVAVLFSPAFWRY